MHAGMLLAKHAAGLGGDLQDEVGPSQSLLKLLSVNTAGEEVEEKAVICLKAMLAQKQTRPTPSGISTAASPAMRTGRAGTCVPRAALAGDTAV